MTYLRLLSCMSWTPILLLGACAAPATPPGDLAAQTAPDPVSEARRTHIRDLAHDLLLPYQVAVDHKDVYWVNSGTQIRPQGSVMRIARHGGQAQVLADKLDSPQGMVVDDEAVYWLDTGSFAGTGQLKRVSKAGGEPVVLASGLEFAVSLVADDQFLYVEDGLRVFRIAKQGGTPEVLFDSGNFFLSIATGLAIDDQHLYFEYSQVPGSFSIYSITKTGGDMTALATINALIPPSTFIAVDDSFLYWTDEVDGTIRRAPKAGGPSIALVTGLVTPPASGFFVTDAHRLFFAQQCGSYDTSQGFRVCAGPGGVYSVDRDGGPLHTVVSGDPGFLGVAVGRNRVYFTNQSDGTLQSAPR